MAITIKEAVIKRLDDLKTPANYADIYKHIIDKGYYTFSKDAKTPALTVSGQLSEFIRTNDARVKRIKQDGGGYAYYLTTNEQNISVEVLTGATETQVVKKVDKTKTYEERSLHKLLSSYLKNSSIYSKTIFHESSTNKDSNQIWTHPDMVGIRFLKLQTKASENFLKAINQVETFKLFSYEIKKEINNDSDLKKAFFQAVSNSSWANFGYLVAFEINDSLSEEMERLNQSFGIGIIELNANPYQSKILFPATYHNLDIKTIDKLCNNNKEFAKFIEQTHKLMTAAEGYYKSTEKELDELCDDYFAKDNDTEIEKYCRDKYIPIEDDENN